MIDIYKILDRASEESYSKFFSKDSKSWPARAMCLKTSQYIAEAVKKSSCSSMLKPGTICVLNPHSYMNIVRVLESSARYVNEMQQTTQPASKLIECLEQHCRRHISHNSNVSDDFDRVFVIDCYDPDKTEQIFGNVVLERFPFDTTKISAESHVKTLAREALLLGYNYVTHEVHEVSEENGSQQTVISIQFEATYFSSNIKPGDILWHVAPKSISHKILARGLLPSNSNAMGFNYEPRVFCFIDRDDMLMKSFAKSSGKSSKKFLSREEASKLVDVWTEL